MDIEELKRIRAAIHAEAIGIIAAAKADGNRAFTADETATLEDRYSKITQHDTDIKAAERSAQVAQMLGALPTGTDANEDRQGLPAGKSWGTLGEHFVKSVTAEVLSKWHSQHTKNTFSAPDFNPAALVDTKAATDPQLVGSVWGPGGAFPVLNQFDQTTIQAVRPRLLVADLLGSGVISGTGVTYLIEGGVEGAFTTVAENGQKPQLHFVDPTTVTDTLKKIAGFITISDEMLEDLPFLVTEINNRLLYERAKMEEAQLVSGNGTGTNLLGLLNRSGVQTVARGTVASGDTAPDALFRAITAVSTGAGLDADGIMIHPLDYQTIRLMKDGNGQYFGGGFFAGQYGSGTLQDQPPIWGLRTVVTTAATQGQAVVGAFGQAATVYRKGGVRVESTNSDGTDFQFNRIKIRAENRVALAVRRPAGIVKVTLTAAP